MYKQAMLLEVVPYKKFKTFLIIKLLATQFKKQKGDKVRINPVDLIPFSQAFTQISTLKGI